MIPEWIHVLAQQNGYTPAQLLNTGNYIADSNFYDYQAALSPLFWQALGKALGPFADGEGRLYLQSPRGVAIHDDIDWARYSAHRFYDLILQGQPTDAYWNEVKNVEQLN